MLPCTSQCILYNSPWYCCKHYNVCSKITLGIAAHITMCAVRSPLVLLQTSQCVLYNHPRYCCKHHNVHCTLTLGTASNIIMCAIYQSFAYLHTSQCFHSYWKHHNVTQCKVVMQSCTHCNVAQCHLAVSLVWHFQYIIMPLQLQLQSNCCAHCTAFLLLCSVTSWFSYLHWCTATIRGARTGSHRDFWWGPDL